MGRTPNRDRSTRQTNHFNSLAPCGANRIGIHRGQTMHGFQLTRPVWGEPWDSQNPSTICAFQLTRPVWGEPCDFQFIRFYFLISTHSPRVGRTYFDVGRTVYFVISTHSPRVGRTHLFLSWSAVPGEFQLTRPVWGEPIRLLRVIAVCTISTHSPRVGRTATPFLDCFHVP